jgi:filamentous hemagglutinin family protein
MKSLRRCAPLLAFCLTSTFVAAATLAAPDYGIEGVTMDGEKVAPLHFNGDLRFLPKAAPANDARQRVYRPLLTIPPQKPTGSIPTKPDLRPMIAPSAPMPAPSQNFAGISFNDVCSGGQCGSGWPPDTNGDVGPNHYIQAVNQAFGIYSKSGVKLAAFTDNQLWSAAGASPSNGNSQGDPIVIYDALADRWILTQFAFPIVSGNPASPMYQCIAVSKTSDPVAGGWYFYPLRMDPGTSGKPPVNALNDYAKFGIWNDCLYMAANEFSFPTGSFVGTAYASFSRADMYAGLPLTWSLGYNSNNSEPFTMLPSNASGKAASAIPAGTPNYFVSESQTAFAFEIRKFVAGANCGGGGSLSLPAVVSQASYNFNLPNASQPNTSHTLATTGDRLMQKAQYRKVGTKESLWVVHTTQTPGGRLAPQWAQLDVTGGVIATTPVQEQIYAPDSILHRWMGSIAVDAKGNMAVGYSTSGDFTPNFPSIAYSGRLVTDPLNQLPQSEVQLIAGLGSQTHNCGGAPCDRWGDYTAMSVDPVDDCTFWYTNEYYSSQGNGSIGNWQTRIGSFKFASCASLPASTTTVTSSANPSVAGVTITLTATVTGIAPTGTVLFADGATTITGCAAVALTGAGNTRTAACMTSALAQGSHTINATYSGDAGNAPSSGALTQVVTSTVPGTATVITNPYGTLSVTGATLIGNTISNFTSDVVIQLGSIAGSSGVAAEIDFQSLDLGPGGKLTIRSGAPGQFIFLVVTGATPSGISGQLLAQGIGPAPPIIYFKNKNGITVNAGGVIQGLAGIAVDAVGAVFTVGQPVVNNGVIDGGTGLELVAAKINGGGQFKGDSIIVRTFGNANNPVNGGFFLQNGLKFGPSGPTGGIGLTINAYGSAPQALNFSVTGNATVWMPSAWPAGSTVPVNNAVVPPGGVRAAGVPNPGYGGGSMIVQATGSLTLVNGGTNDFVFPGGIVLKADGDLNFNGVLVDQGWTTTGQSFQGLFFESPNIVSPANIQLYSNDLNWANFSTFPHAPVRAFTLIRNANGTASFAAADGTAPHLNTYSILSNTAASGGCWSCLVNTQPVNMFGP